MTTSILFRKQSFSFFSTTIKHVTLVFLVCIISLLWLQRALLTNGAFVTADAAADNLLVRDALSLRLQTGHYSRFGFNHPGPFFFYAMVPFIWFGKLFLSAPYADLAFATLAVNACWLTLIYMMLLALNTSKTPVSATDLTPISKHFSAIIGTTVFALALGTQGFLTDTWMPSRIAFAGAAFTLAAVGLANGQLRFLTPFMFSAGAMIHGYVSAVLWVASMTVVCTLMYFTSKGWRNDFINVWRRQFLLSAIIILAFALIPLWDLLRHPGDNNIGRILSASRDASLYTKPNDWLVAFKFGIESMTSLPMFITTAGLCTLVISILFGRSKTLWCILIVAITLSITTIVFAHHSPSALGEYIVRFSNAGVWMTISLIVAVSVSRFFEKLNGEVQLAQSRRLLWAISIASVALVITLSRNTIISSSTDVHVTATVATNLLHKIGSNHSKKIAWVTSGADNWQHSIGTFNELERMGYNICLQTALKEPIYSTRRECRRQIDHNNFFRATHRTGEQCKLSTATPLSFGCLFSEVDFPPNLRVGNVISFKEKTESEIWLAIHTQGFYPASDRGAWSHDTMSTINLSFDTTTEPSTEDIIIEFAGEPFLWGTLIEQTVFFSVGEKPLSSWTLGRDKSTHRYQLNIPRERFTSSGTLILQLRYSDPRSPRALGISSDPRLLAVHFEEMTRVR